MEYFIFKPKFIIELIPVLAGFIPVTLLITLLSAVIGLLLGAGLAAMKLSRYRFLRLLARGYTTVMRCTPSIVLLFVVYYGLPMLVIALFDINIHSWPNLLFAVVSLALLFSATSSELLRSAYLAVDKGQREAAVSLGLSPFQAFYRIILPQCVKIIIHNLSLSLIALMKEAALAFTIGVIDLMGKAKLVIANNFGALGLETYLAVALIYWVISFAVGQAVRLLERRRYGRQIGNAG
jgi:L-cystine transport system permease protein